MYCFVMYKYYEMIRTISLVNIHRSYNFFFLRTLKICILSNFQIYMTALLTIAPLLCIIFPGLIYLIAGNLYPLTTFHPFLPLPTHIPSLGNHQSPLCIYEFSFGVFFFLILCISEII